MSSKGKGGGFEREVSTLLSLWVSDGTRDDIFWRSHGSGGRATCRGKSGKTTEGQYGDQSATDPLGKPLIKAWCIECKTGYASSKKKEVLSKDGTAKKKTSITNWCLLDLIDSRQEEPVILALWRQTVSQASQAGNEPVLIFRRPLMSPCIVFQTSYFLKLENFFGKANIPVIQVRMNLHNMVIMSFYEFMEWIPNIHGILKE